LDRTSRVRRLKRIIVITLISMIILPIVLCCILFHKLSTLELENEELRDYSISLETDINMLRSKIESELTEQDTKISRLGDSIDSLDQQETVEEEEEVVWPQKVYLTFDDGPSGHTLDILDVLDRYDVKATFFVCATQNEDYQELYSEILNRGHVLGVHSYSHVYNDIYRSEEDFEEDVTAIRNFVSERTGGFVPVYYRFPGGSTNIGSKMDMDTCVAWLNDQGMKYFDWNISSNDATNPMQPAEVIIENSTKGCEKYREVMILMHDLGNKDSTVEALPLIIEFYQNRGAEIAVIDQDTMLIQHE